MLTSGPPLPDSELAQIQSLAEISARLGTQILEEDVEQELLRLQSGIERLENAEMGQVNAGTEALPFPPYHTEEVDAGMLAGVDDKMDLLEFQNEDDCVTLLEDLQEFQLS